MSKKKKEVKSKKKEAEPKKKTTTRKKAKKIREDTNPRIFTLLLSGATTLDRIKKSYEVGVKNITETKTKLTGVLEPSKSGTTHAPSINYETGEYVCTCEDHLFKHYFCKHLIALIRKVISSAKKDKFDRFMENYEKGEIEQKALVTGVVPTGVESIDKLFFGGWPTEVLTVLTGESKIGKTWLCFQTGAYNAVNGGKTLYIETEGVYSRKQALDQMIQYFTQRNQKEFRENFDLVYPRTIERLCALFGIGLVVGEKENMKTAHTFYTTGDDAFPLYKLVKQKGYNFIVIDSISKPLKIKIPVPPNQNRGARAAVLNPLLGRMERLAEDLNCAVVAIIHLSKAEGAGKGKLEDVERVWGGETLKYNIKYVVQIRRGMVSENEYKQGVKGKQIIRREWVAVLPAQADVKVVPNYGYVDK